MMRVIFLDIDGVLTTPDSLKHGRNADPLCVAALNEIVRTTGAKIVVSSSWRGQPDLLNVFSKWGCKFAVIGHTPRLERRTEGGVYVGVERGDEIQAWLDANPAHWRSFVILDDSDDMGQLKKFLVQTDYKIGLTWGDVAKARKILLEGGDASEE